MGECGPTATCFPIECGMTVIADGGMRANCNAAPSGKRGGICYSRWGNAGQLQHWAAGLSKQACYSRWGNAGQLQRCMDILLGDYPLDAGMWYFPAKIARIERSSTKA